MAQITYSNKTFLNQNPSIPEVNKVTDANMNEIKSVVNANATETSTAINEIKDAEVYSTNEVKTNKVWIDGKPLYRRVYTFNAVSGNHSYALNPAPSNVDKMWFDLSATFLFQQGSGYTRQGIDPNSSDHAFDFSTRVTSKTNLNIYVGGSVVNGAIIYATMLYTKTTDEASS